VDLETLRDLWEWTPPAEVTEHSTFNWHQIGAAKFTLPLLSGEITVEKNVLNKFDVKVRYGSKAGERTFDTLQEALSRCEGLAVR
jgi:hypothetical protein